MSYTLISSVEQYEQAINSKPAVAVYFKGPNCSVCTVLLPKLEAMLARDLPQIILAVVDCEATPDLATQNTILTVPALLVYLDGKVFLRQIRHISLDQLGQELRRPYEMLFG